MYQTFDFINKLHAVWKTNKKNNILTYTVQGKTPYPAAQGC